MQDLLPSATRYKPSPSQSPHPSNTPPASRAGEFMLARYREVCDTVLRFRDSKEKLIRRAVITLLPRLAAFAPERFVKSYLKQVCMWWRVGGWVGCFIDGPALAVPAAPLLSSACLQQRLCSSSSSPLSGTVGAPPHPHAGHRVPAVCAGGAGGARRRLHGHWGDGVSAGTRWRGCPHEDARRLPAPHCRRHQGVPGPALPRPPALP